MTGVSREMEFEQVDVELRFGDPRFARDGEQMQDEVGRARRRGSRHRRIAEARWRDEGARIAALLDRLDRRPARLVGGSRFVRMDGGNVVEPHRREAEEAQGQRHRVGGELAAAGARARAGMGLDVFQLCVADRAGAVRADSLEHILDGDCLAGDAARHDRAAVEDDARQIEPCRRHRRGGQSLVAADQEQHAVERMAAHGELGRIGDQLAAHQRGPHAARAHGDAVGDDDRVEVDRGAAGCLDPAPGVIGEVAQVHVARGYSRPAVDDGDERLGERFLVIACGAEHGPGRGTGGAFNHFAGRPAWRRHETFLLRLGYNRQAMSPSWGTLKVEIVFATRF